MNRFENWLLAEEKNSSNKIRAVIDMVEAIKLVFKDYDIATRKKIWQELTSVKGKELVEKLVRNPKTYLSDSEFVKLVQGRSSQNG